MTVHANTLIGRLVVEVERLCDRVANVAAAPDPAVCLELIPVTSIPGIGVSRNRIDSAGSEMKAMFAFTGVEESRAADREDLMSFVECPKCESRDTRRARQRTAIDECLRLFSLNPWRCRACGARFYHVIWAVTWRPLDAVRRRLTSNALRVSRLMRSG